MLLINFYDGVRRDQHLLLDTFVASMKHLELLTLSSAAFLFTDRHELMRRLGSECKNIKHLKSKLIFDHGKDLTIIQSFERIESLALRLSDFDHHDIVSLVEHLPFLKK